MSESKTPRTDAQSCECGAVDGCECCPASLARQLKTELAAGNEAYEIVRKDCWNLTEKVIPNLRERIAELEHQLAQAQEFVKEFADEPCEYGDDCTENAMWERRHGRCNNCKARVVIRALPIESAPMRRDQKLAAAGIKPRPLLNALRKDESATPAPAPAAEASDVPPEASGAQGAADQRETQRLNWLILKVEEPIVPRFWYAGNDDYLVKYRSAIDAAMSAEKP